MATNQARLRAILEGVKDAPVTDAFIDKNADACVYNSTDAEVESLTQLGVNKSNISQNQKRNVLLKKIEQSLKDMREKAAADKADADAAAAKAAAIVAANVE